MNPLQQEIFYQQFGNQPRAQKPYHQRKTYLCYQLTQHGGSMTYTVCLQNKVLVGCLDPGQLGKYRGLPGSQLALLPVNSP